MSTPLPGQAVAFIQVSDRERALAFYRDTLGMPLHAADEHGDFLLAGGALVRITVLPDYEPHPHPVFGWNVPDLDAVARDLRERGVRFTVYEGMGQDDLGIWASPDGRTKVAWFPDPDGNVLSLSQT